MSDLIYLSDVCMKYFGLSDRIAHRKAALGTLPVPAFKLSGTRVGPWYISQASLDAHVEEQMEKASELNRRMKQAGLA